MYSECNDAFTSESRLRVCADVCVMTAHHAHHAIDVASCPVIRGSAALARSRAPDKDSQRHWAPSDVVGRACRTR